MTQQNTDVHDVHTDLTPIDHLKRRVHQLVIASSPQEFAIAMERSYILYASMLRRIKELEEELERRGAI